MGTFDDINLGDTPQLDLSFGETATKDTGSSFGFGGWGSNWNTTSKWGFGTTDAGTTETTDITKGAKDTSVDGGESDMWSSLGGNKKNKKKTTTAGFDFGDSGTLDETKDHTASADADDWGGFGKKDTQNKKTGAFEDLGAEADNIGIGTAVDEPAANDSWSTWGTATTTKGKKKGKKEQTEDIPPVPPPPPAAPVDADWSGFGSKKDKKKNKKDAGEEHAEEPPVIVVPEPGADADAGWGTFGTKKDKKKGKKNQAEEMLEEPATVIVPEKEPEAEADIGWGSFGSGKKEKDKRKGKKGAFEDAPNELSAIVPEPEVDADLGWGSFGASKKAKETDKKKGKKNAIEEVPEEPAVVVVPEPEPEADTGWSFGSKREKDKGKKGKKGEPVKEEPAVTVVPEVESTLETGWGVFGSKKEKDKKGKKKGFLDDTGAADEANKTEILDPALEVDNSFASWGTTTKKDKKGKKGLVSEVTEDPIAVAEPVAAADVPAVEDDWMNFGTTDKRKDKKGKKGAAADNKNEEPLPPPPPPPPAAPEPSTTDIWGSGKKDKKGKKGTTSDKAKDEVIAVLDPVEPAPEPAEEDFGGWGLSAKDKKKKEKEQEKERKEKEKEEREREREEKEKKEKEEKEEKEKAAKEKAKPEKKSKGGTAAKSFKTEDLLEDSVLDVPPMPEEDSWGGGTWGTSTKIKKKGGKNAVPDIPPPVPTPPAQGLTPEPELIAGLDDIGDDGWASFAPAKAGKASKSTTKSTKVEDKKAAKKGTKAKEEDALVDILAEQAIGESKKKESPKEESAAKAAKSFWGTVGTTSTGKFNTTRDKKDKESEQAQQASKDLLGLDDLDDEIIGIVEEPPTRGSKTKTGSKLAKTGSKDSKDSDKFSKTTGDKKKKTEDTSLDDLLELGDEAPAPDETGDQKDDAWSFWGSAKKTGVRKADEGKKEITKAEVANQKVSLKNSLKKDLEAPMAAADEPSPQPPKTSKTAMSTAKSTKSSAVLQRVKDLEKEGGKARGKSSEADTQLPEPELEPLSTIDSPPKKSGTTNKSKNIPASNSASAKKKDSSPPVDKVKAKKPIQDSVPGTFPGSFPAEGADDDIVDIIDLSPVDKKTKKSAKAKKQQPAMDEFDFDAPAPEAPPTPPPEPLPAKPAAKKERARVVRDEGVSSWGFWGASPKKDPKKGPKSQDDTDAIPAKLKEKPPAPGLGRSKSTRTAKEKDKELEKSSKSSASDEKEKKSPTRPSKSRGSSFGGFFGGPPPVRAKTVRRSSNAASKTASSHRHSVDVDAMGLPSPPAEEAPEMNAKAAKLMGAGPGKLDRKAPIKGKQKSKGGHGPVVNLDETVEADQTHTAVPDPYPIDDDDMVMIGGLGDAIADDPPAFKTPVKKDKSRSKSKKEVRQSRLPLRSISLLPVRSRPKQHSRGAWIKANVGPKQPKPADDFAEDVIMVEAGSPQDDFDGAKENLAFDERPRLQRANTSARKSKGGMMGLFGGFGKTRRASETFERPKSKGIITDDEGLPRRKRPVTGNDDSAKRLRRDDRKVRRSTRDERVAEGYVYDAPTTNDADDAEAQARKEDRRARRREAEKAEEDARKANTKAARDRRARKEEEAEAIRLEEKRARKAARDDMNAKLGPDPSSRPRKSDRRRSHVDPPISAADEEAERRARRETRRAGRTAGEKSTKKPVDDYFDPRNGGGGDPYMNGAANDHTSGWVKSQLSTPADPPPLEPTVIEPPPFLGGGTDPADDEAARRAKRKSRRQSRYVDGGPEDEVRRRRKEREVRSSEGSREDDPAARAYSSRRKSDMSGLKSFDARPSLAAGGKRGSWFKKMGL